MKEPKQGDIYYVKRGNRYHQVGNEFMGFPSNGIWLVKDGMNNCLIQLNENTSIPHKKLFVAQYKEQCIEHLRNKMNGKGVSINQIINWTVDFFAEILEKGKENDRTT